MKQQPFGIGVHAYGRELEVAVRAVREAAQLCQAVQEELAEGVLEKRDRSPVTIADFGSQALVCRRLREAFPEDPIIAEEDAAALREPGNAGLRDSVVRHVGAVRPEADEDEVLSWIDYGGAHAYADRFWTLDPIDGTKGFLRREQYALALALIVEGEVVVAALACPNLPMNGQTAGRRGSIYVAVRGAGTAELPLADDGQAGEGARRVHVSAEGDPARVRWCESVEAAHSAHGDAAVVADRLGLAMPPIRMDSQAKYAVVARGEGDLYLRLPTRLGYMEKIWDHAAGSLIAAEAGGRVTDMTGKPLEFHHGAELRCNRGIVVTNGVLHDRVLAALSDSVSGR